jgi:beta-glucosidase
MKILKTAILLIAGLSCCFSQAPSPGTPEVDLRVDALLKRLTLEEKIDLLGGIDGFFIRDMKEIGLPRLKMADGPFGVRNYGPATTFAGGIALAASWDPQLAERVGMVIGQDARSRGVHFLLGPGVNIYRAPLCGRNFEYFGEDPFLASRIAVGYIKGVQSQGVSATVKHFMGNNSEYNRHNANSIIDERTMREIYLPAFEAAVKEGHVGAVMDSYNLTNGIHMSQNGWLNDDVLKKEWGFEGITMSDWSSTYDGVAAARNGLDLEMPSGLYMNRTTLLPAISSGVLAQALVDDKLRRILRTAVQFGWMDRDQADLTIPRVSFQGRHTALESARASMVLLKNEGNILPLDKKKIKSIALIGPDVYPAQPVGGGSAAVQPFHAMSDLEAISEYLGDAAKVYYTRALPTTGEVALATDFTTEPQGGERGLREEMFTNPELRGAPSTQGIRQHIDFKDDAAASLNNLSARWTGYFTPPAAGDYELMIEGPGESGGYRLFLDDKPLIDHWKTSPALLSCTKLSLSAMPHAIRLEYFVKNNWAAMGLKLGIVRPGNLVSTDAKAMAAAADVVLIVVGFDRFSESESADRTFELPIGQDELIQQIAAINKNTIVSITSGGGVDMTQWVDRVPALFQSWYAGEEGGTALAELLFGDYSPSGKLPISLERSWKDNPVHDSYYPAVGNDIVYKEGVFLGYRHYDRASVKPLFPFGYGLSYTTFSYAHLQISPSTSKLNEPVKVSFDVTNTGQRPGAEVAEVYVGETRPRVPRPLKELKGFGKVELRPGETKRVEVLLDRRAFSYFDEQQHRWTANPGDFGIYVGSSSTQIRLTGHITLQELARTARLSETGRMGRKKGNSTAPAHSLDAFLPGGARD